MAEEMQDPTAGVEPAQAPAEDRRALPPEALRALAEAEERRQALAANPVPRAKEYGGPDRLEPVRYGDWEKKGLAVDF